MARADEPGSGECPARALIGWPRWPLASLASAARAGLLDDAFGIVWQWTRSAYLPYPGYRAADGALGEARRDPIELLGPT